jgi:ATP-dependent Clp protease ATP-binding subunit ClpB
VVLFDEVEKAHPDVWNTLLQVLDDGRLTDGQGRTVDFKNTILILTSNVGSHAAAAIEDDPALSDEAKSSRVRAAVMAEVRQGFRPEFLNRLDELVVFRRLAKEQMLAIVDIQLARFAGRVEKRGLGIEITSGAKELLMQHGWDPQYGARPLKRAIQRYLEDELARRLLGGEFTQGDRIKVDRAMDRLAFSKVLPN